jgi:hypothetical protein
MAKRELKRIDLAKAIEVARSEGITEGFRAAREKDSPKYEGGITEIFDGTEILDARKEGIEQGKDSAKLRTSESVIRGEVYPTISAAKGYVSLGEFDRAKNLYDQVADRVKDLPGSERLSQKVDHGLKMLEFYRKRNNQSVGAGATVTLAIVGILAGLFLLLTNLPNNSIQLSPGAPVSNFGLIAGVVSILIGIAATYFWMREK